MWTDLRQNIEAIRLENKIAESDFRPVDIHSWMEIEQKIISTFCKIESHNVKFYWLWESFTQETYTVQMDINYPFDELLKLVDPSEKVWLFVEDSAKFWFYEGLINPIVFVLRESLFVDEIYIASKKYEWLLCINHHDIIIATGLHMPDKLKQIEIELTNQKGN